MLPICSGSGQTENVGEEDDNLWPELFNVAESRNGRGGG